MEWEEISRRLRNGTSVQILADLAGCTYKTMYNRIRQHERKDGKKYIKPEQMKRPFETKRKKEPDPGPAASNSSNVILCESCIHLRPETATGRPYCKKYEHMCGLIYVCEGYTAGVPEVEPIGEEKAPDVPEVVEKVADVPEVVREFSGIPEGVVKDTLESYRQSHADAVKQMHDIEDMYKEAKRTEMQIRAICFALERLLEGAAYE